jgi:hypothetical protein
MDHPGGEPPPLPNSGAQSPALRKGQGFCRPCGPGHEAGLKAGDHTLLTGKVVRNSPKFRTAPASSNNIHRSRSSLAAISRMLTSVEGGLLVSMHAWTSLIFIKRLKPLVQRLVRKYLPPKGFNFTLTSDASRLCFTPSSAPPVFASVAPTDRLSLLLW